MTDKTPALVAKKSSTRTTAKKSLASKKSSTATVESKPAVVAKKLSPAVIAKKPKPTVVEKDTKQMVIKVSKQTASIKDKSSSLSSLSALSSSSSPSPSPSSTTTITSPVEDSNVVYVGRIPHGFYENEMKAYFSQFGEITNLRLSRNKKTGAPKHYAFIQFKEPSVAAVVAETMDQYLLFDRLLQCKLVAKDKIHPSLWKGANRVFRVLPRATLARRTHNKERTPEENQVRANRMLQREARKRAQLASLAIDYDFPGYAACNTA